MSGSGEDWTPDRPYWRGGSVARLGPERAAPVMRAFSPTIDRLPGEARSVVVPAFLALGAIVLSLVVAVVGLTIIGAAIERSGVADDLDNIGADRTPAEIRACRERAADLDEAHRRYVQRNDEDPEDIDDLDAGATDFVIGRDGRPVPAPGSECEGVVGDASTGDAIGNRAGIAAEEVAASIGVLLIVLAVLAFLALPGLLSWWLATAYRCLPRISRHKNPRKAYALVRTYAVAVPLVMLAQTLINVYVLPEDELFAAALQLLVNLLYMVAIVRALLVVIDMIGAVTFEFCGRHYGTSRAMRICVWAFITLPWVAALLFASAYGARETAWASTGLLIAVLVVYTIEIVVIPIVFVACLFVSIGMATAGIERTLRRGAQEIMAAEAEGRDLPSTRESLLV